ncbi:MAG: hypothetical protein RLZZ253_320 [Verrucomicrobiota bacterium]
MLGFLAVALGAFGAHGLKPVLLRHDTLSVWQTAALYHLVHAAVLLGLSAWNPFRSRSWGMMAAGVLVFSGSLYVLAVTQIKWLGAVTPLGGLLLLAGWTALAFGKRAQAPQPGE